MFVLTQYPLHARDSSKCLEKWWKLTNLLNKQLNQYFLIVIFLIAMEETEGVTKVHSPGEKRNDALRK